jgi:hypothetical protein
VGRLVKKIGLFVLVSVLLLGPVCYLSLRSYHRVLDAPVFKLDDSITVLAAGDSHIEACVDPGVLHHAASIARATENYFYTYYKLRRFVQCNPNISTVILGFSWHNFPREYQESFLTGHRASTLRDYYLLLDREGKDRLRTWTSAFLVPWMRFEFGIPLQIYDGYLLQWRSTGAVMSRDELEFVGGHIPSAVSKVDMKQIRRKWRVYYGSHPGPGSDISPYMMEYLRKILTLCAQRNIRVVLLNGPVTPLYAEGVPARAVADLDSIRTVLTSEFTNTEYYDCSGYELPQEYFLDGDHVNSKGAAVIMRYVAERLSTSPR